jgi:phenylacetate-CoA ligase
MQKFRIEDDLSFQDDETIRREQQRLLNEHLAYCRKQSPYYRRILADLPEQRFRLEDLPSLPLTAKNDLAQHNHDFTAVPDTEIADLCFTSGTTGRPCRITYTRQDLDRLAYNDALGFLAAGMKPSDNILLTCTIDRCFIAGLAYYMGVLKVGATAVRNGLNSLESHTEIIRDGGITGIVGVPSFLAKLGQHLHNSGIDSSAIRQVICIGEPLRNREMQLTPLGKILETFWPGAVFSTYASSEMATSFTECQQRCGGHPPADLAIVEIIGEDGQPLPPGQCGEVTVTPLQVTGMPLLRFRTGDISFQLPEKCACGRNTLRLGPVLGRRAQMLKVRGTTLFPNVFFHVLDGIAGVDNYYLEVSGDALSDELDLYISFHSGDIESLHIREALYARSRLHINLHCVSCEQTRQKVFGTSRKPTRFFDLRQKQPGQD